MASVKNEFERLADFDMWEDVIVLFVGFIVPTLLKNTLDSRAPVDIPDEVYGLVVIVGAGYLLDGDMKTMASLGGGLYTVDVLLEDRLGLKSRIQNMAASAGGN